jgi:putative transposase
VVDDFNREALAIEIDLNLPAARIIRVLDRVAQQRGFPSKLRCDNGPELVSIALAGWAEDHGVELDFIKPGKPTQNSYVERFNRTYRDEILDLYLFRSLAEVRDLTRELAEEIQRRSTARCARGPQSRRVSGGEQRRRNL